MHLHHRLVDVHQLLQLQLLALVRQLAQRAALLQVRLQLDQPSNTSSFGLFFFRRR